MTPHYHTSDKKLNLIPDCLYSFVVDHQTVAANHQLLHSLRCIKDSTNVKLKFVQSRSSTKHIKLFQQMLKTQL